MNLRKLRAEEKDLLKDFLYEAIYIPEGVEPPAREIIEQPELKLYYEDFGSGSADYCVVAEDDGHVVGAVWTRIMNMVMWMMKRRHLPFHFIRNIVVKASERN